MCPSTAVEWGRSLESCWPWRTAARCDTAECTCICVVRERVRGMWFCLLIMKNVEKKCALENSFCDRWLIMLLLSKRKSSPEPLEPTTTVSTILFVKLWSLLVSRKKFRFLSFFLSFFLFFVSFRERLRCIKLKISKMVYLVFVPSYSWNFLAVVFPVDFGYVWEVSTLDRTWYVAFPLYTQY
jgi:hypothetical protein